MCICCPMGPTQNVHANHTMAKIKTHKASAKRFTLTKSGKVKLNHTNRRHKLGLKAPKRKRQLRRNAYLSESMAPTVRTLIRH